MDWLFEWDQGQQRSAAGECPRCRGVGRYYVVRGGRYLMVDCELCRPARVVQRLRGVGGLSVLPAGVMASWRLDNCTITGDNAQAVRLLQERIARPYGMVTLYGPPGVGKTRLLASAVNSALGAGHVAMYVVVPELLDYFRRAFAPDSQEDGDALYRLALEADLLALDEVDKFHPTSWAQERFFVLLDSRYRDAAQRMTIIASNVPVSKMPDYVRSRLEARNNTVIALVGPDWRRLPLPNLDHGIDKI